ADVRADRRKIVVFCADNGVTEEGICGSDPAVTAVIAANIAAGRGNVSVMAKAAGCEVVCADVGMFSPGGHSMQSKDSKDTNDVYDAACPKKKRPCHSWRSEESQMDRKPLLSEESKPSFLGDLKIEADRKLSAAAESSIFRCCVRSGTRNFSKEPAMTHKEAEAAISIGMGIAGELADNGADLLLAGEAGIGNTTTSAAVAAALLHLPANAVAGRGAGLDDEGLARKVRVIDEALDKYGLRRENPDASDFTHGVDAFRVLCCVGGLDIAAMAGFYIGCAKARVPAILDGAISAAAALLAERLAPGTRHFLLASHQSREPMAAYILEEMDLTPILHASLALGEGTGGICLLPIIDLALAAYHNAATFAESGLAVSREEGPSGTGSDGHSKNEYYTVEG
ncbi:MAG: nicotinate-nucleotide--dimethylbenzimidazole phosphoribosyltransferase, partial [Lachnospiraceae bacterium]